MSWLLSHFFDAARQEALIGLIRNKLYEQFGVTGDEGLVAQGIFPEYISKRPRISKRRRTALRFTYNPYDIGCYALGESRGAYHARRCRGCDRMWACGSPAVVVG